MKKLISLIIIFGAVFFFNTANAQILKYPLVLGIKAGGSLSTTSSDNYTMRGGLAAGLVVDYELTRELFIRSGLDFMMKGGKYDQNFEGMKLGVLERARKTTSIHLNYLQIPLTFGYKKKVGDEYYIYGAAGMYGAVAVYGKGRYTLNSNLTSERVKYDDFDDLQFKKVDYGIVGAFGVEYQRYSINIGYEYGLLNINKVGKSSSQISPITNGDSWHNMNATCTLGYKF